MKTLIKKYLNLPYEKRLILNTLIFSLFSIGFLIYKFIIGILYSDLILTTAVFGIFVLLAKLASVKGSLSKQKHQHHKYRMITVFLLAFSGFVYIVYMTIATQRGFVSQQYNIYNGLFIATLSAIEFVLAIVGLLATKNRWYFYKNIKIINLIGALSSALITQIAVLSFLEFQEGIYNAYLGIFIGLVTIISSIYIYLLPKIGVEENRTYCFKLIDASKNNLIDFNQQTNTIYLIKSFIYGSWEYLPTTQDKIVKGKIIQQKSLFQRVNIYIKIIWIILIELIGAFWLFGYFFYFLRTLFIIGILNHKMKKNGFKKLKNLANETNNIVLNKENFKILKPKSEK